MRERPNFASAGKGGCVAARGIVQFRDRCDEGFQRPCLRCTVQKPVDIETTRPTSSLGTRCGQHSLIFSVNIATNRERISSDQDLA